MGIEGLVPVSKTSEWRHLIVRGLKGREFVVGDKEKVLFVKSLRKEKREVEEEESDGACECSCKCKCDIFATFQFLCLKVSMSKQDI